MRAGTDVQVVVRGRHPQLIEKYLRHGVVVMLAGMNQDRFDILVPAKFGQQRGDLHHVRPGADDAHDSQAVVAHTALFAYALGPGYSTGILTALGAATSR